MALTDNLSGYWKLNETSGTRADSHGTNHLTDVNTVGSAPGKIYGAGQFVAASTEYLTIVNPPTLALGASNLTITAWVYIDGGGSATIASKWRPGSAQYEYYLYYSGSTFNWNVYTPDLPVTIQSTFGTPALGTWYFLTAQFTLATLTGSLKVNNGTAVTEAGTGTPPSTTAPFRIGADGDGGQPWNGRIDEVGVWKRVLSAPEIQQVYNYGNGLTYPFTTVDLPLSPLTATATSYLITITGTSTVFAAGLATATATTLVASTTAGTIIAFARAEAGLAVFLPYARGGFQVISAWPLQAAAQHAAVSTFRTGGALVTPAWTATASAPEIGITILGRVLPAEVMEASARFPLGTPWSAYRPGVRTVLAAPRRLTVLARAGVERAE